MKYDTAILAVTPSQQYRRITIIGSVSARAEASMNIGVTGRKNMGKTKITRE